MSPALFYTLPAYRPCRGSTAACPGQPDIGQPGAGQSAGGPAVAARLRFCDRPAPWSGRPWAGPLLRHRRDGKTIEATGLLVPVGLALTGERTLPGIASENYWFRRHEAAYRHLREEVAGPRLLEVGAGEGYGSALLAERVPQVLALDYDAAATVHLARRYPRLAAARANLAALPVAGAAVDTVISLQVIEHVWDHPQFLAECHRVLRPGGLLVLSTPNRLTFSPGAGPADRPVNPFHTHEFTARELCRLVAGAGFSVLAARGLFAGPALAELDRRHGGLVAAQLASEPADWPAELAADVAAVGWRDFAVGDDARADLSRLDGSLDLILLARRP
ncbi:MAG: class I SAM-dependent methyltransferase [Actinobacteria bacterium]|nr:class I SAM-dependent methyltransferase [Actinomycetota bacterium]